MMPAEAAPVPPLATADQAKGAREPRLGAGTGVPIPRGMGYDRESIGREEYEVPAVPAHAGEKTIPPPPTYDGVVDACQNDARSTRSPASGRRLRTLRVLVAEPDPKLRSALLLVLTEANFEVLGVGDGRRALQAIATQPPHAIIANMALPNVAGSSLLGWARARLGEDLLVTILIAATLPSQLMPECPAADAVLGSPLTPQAVVDAVRARLERHRPA